MSVALLCPGVWEHDRGEELAARTEEMGQGGGGWVQHRMHSACFHKLENVT